MDYNEQNDTIFNYNGEILIQNQLYTFGHEDVNYCCISLNGEEEQITAAQLPYLVLYYIFSLLSPEDLCNACCVCSSWYNVANNQKLWLNHCANKGWLHLSQSLFLRQPICRPSCTNVSGMSPLFMEPTFYDTNCIYSQCDAKRLYVRARHLSLNWTLGRYSTSPYLRPPGNARICALSSNAYIVLTGDQAGQLCFWDIAAQQLLNSQQLSDQVGAVAISSCVPCFAAAGTDDGMIHVFMLENFEFFASYVAHSEEVLFVEFCLTAARNGAVISVGADRCVSVWSVEKRRLLHHLKGGHNADISCCQIHDSLLATAAWDCSLVLWDLELGCVRFQLFEHLEAISCLKLLTHYLVSGGMDGAIKMWNIDSRDALNQDRVDAEHYRPALQFKIEKAHPEVYCLNSWQEWLASGGSDSLVKVWSTKDGSCLYELGGHFGVVRSLAMNECRLVSTGDVRKVIVWDYRRGKQLCELHRNPTKVQHMFMSDTTLVLSSPDHPGSITIISFW